MTTGLSEKIREIARSRYVDPAVTAGKQKLSIRVRDILNNMEEEGLHGAGRTPQVCSALQTAKFLKANGLKIDFIEGPPKKQSPTVVVHYRVVGHEAGTAVAQERQEDRRVRPEETPEEWAHRVTGKLYGLLKEEITAMGGAEAFIRWVRSEDEESEEEDAA